MRMMAHSPDARSCSVMAMTGHGTLARLVGGSAGLETPVGADQGRSGSRWLSSRPQVLRIGGPRPRLSWARDPSLSGPGPRAARKAARRRHGGSSRGSVACRRASRPARHGMVDGVTTRREAGCHGTPRDSRQVRILGGVCQLQTELWLQRRGRGCCVEIGLMCGELHGSAVHSTTETARGVRSGRSHGPGRSQWQHELRGARSAVEPGGRSASSPDTCSPPGRPCVQGQRLPGMKPVATGVARGG